MKKYISLAVAFIFCATSVIAQVDRSIQPKAGPAPTINLTSPNTFEAKNGMKVMVVENDKLPRVRVQLVLDNPLHASGKKAGVEAIFSDMMGNGTTTISKDAFNEEVDFLGATLFFGSESAFASSLSKYFPRIMELMADAVKNPLLTQEEFEKSKTRMLENLKNQEKDVSAIASQMGSALLYGKNHPKGEFMTTESISALTLADVKEFYNSYFSPENAYLVIVGDVKTKDAKKVVNNYFANWNTKLAPKQTIAPVTDVTVTEINFINMPNAVQSEIIAQNVVNLKMSDPDYHAVLLANDILGGGGEGNLFLNLREDKGWTYGSYSGIGAGKDVSRFSATASVRNEVTDSSVVEMIKEIKMMSTKPVDAKRLENAKAKYNGRFILALESPQTIANYALNIETEDLDEDFYKNYLKKINAVTPADIQRVAKKYFKADNLRVVVVGKGAEVLEPLKTVKDPSGKVIPVKYFDKYGNPTKEPEFSKPIPVGVTAETVLADYIKAIGGEEAAKNVNSIMMEAAASMQGMQLNMNSKVTNKGQSKVVVSLGGNPMQTILFNNGTGYMVVQGQRMDNDDTMNKQNMMTTKPFMELDATGALEAIETINGTDAYRINFGEGVKAFYDTTTGLKIREAVDVTMMGQSSTSITDYSNYQEVAGVKIPYTVTRYLGPQALDFTVSKVVVNEGVSDADFE
ncbi:M16 family metallopeptidase [Jejudonia soesokkakensis]|uniref:M16 family metallopeptidase n=1 Tax=Jejudonia soesokkakensis TaxID=1323432 RepID=A0ABW2MRE7_9FLAO